MKTKLIFISGIPASGKTTLARRLALEINADKIVDVDILKHTCCIYETKTENPYLWTTSHEAGQIENVGQIEGFQKYSACVQQKILKLLEFLKSEKCVIVEGAQLTPQILEHIDSDYFEVHYFYIEVTKEQLFAHIDQKLKIRKGKWLNNIDVIFKIQKFLDSQPNQTKIKSDNIEIMIQKIREQIKL